MRGDLPERGVGDMRAALILPPLETEALALDVSYSRQTLFPDTTVAEDAGDCGASLADW